MRLKKIKIAGFKSFADKVTLDFHDGITIVVGPNGCGKSNIADAFRWVMGEQSVKSMRGGKMQDVIFAGASKRKPLGMAEVSLTFENNKGLVHVPYHEVEITRRYHRDGESEYLINGNQVRLKDVQSILMDVGIGKNAYAIIEQGKIDQIIQLGPNERRIIFEEAAGILKFLVNKRETEKKLVEIELNCSRLKDIHDEVQKEIDHLASQAARANEYKSLKAKSETLQRDWLSLKIGSLQQKKEGDEASLEALLKSSRILENELIALKKELSSNKEAFERDEAILKDKEKTLYQMRTSLEVKEKELETLKERLLEGEKTQARIGKTLEEIKTAKNGREKDKAGYILRQKELAKDLDKETTSLKKKEEELSKAEEKVVFSRKALEKAQESLLKLTRENNVVSSEMKQKSVRYEASMEKVEKAETEIKQLKEVLNKSDKEVQEKSEALKKASLDVDEAKDLFDQVDQEIKKVVSDLTQSQSQYDALVEELIGLKAREKSLLKLRDEMEGAKEGTKILLKESKKEGSSLFGKLKGLWEFFHIEKGFENAIDAVLRPYSDTLVATNKSDYEAILAFASLKNLTDFSLVWIPEGGFKALKNSLLTKVKNNQVAHHFLSQKLIAETWEEADRMVQKNPSAEVFSLDGFFKDRAGVLFSSSRKTQSLFLREAELKTLQEDIAVLHLKTEKEKEQLEAIREKRKIVTEKRVLCDKELRAKEMGLVDKNYQLQKVKGDQERHLSLLKRTEADKEKGIQEQRTLEQELLELEGKSQKEEGTLKALSEEKTVLLTAVEKDQEQLKIKTLEFKEEKQSFNIKSDETRKILYALNLIDVKDQESFAQEKKLEEEASRLKEQTLLLQAKEKDLLSLSRDHGGDLSVLEEAKSLLEKEMAKKRDGIKGQETEIQKKEDFIKKESAKAQSFEVKLAQTNTQLEVAISEFKENWPDLQPEKVDSNPAFIEKELKKVKSDLEGYQNINLAASETLDQHKSRAQNLETEIGDLLNSSDELKEIIETLEGKSRALFKETFEAVKVNFKKNFSILFNGGEADLELTESDDLLKAGIEIVAKPPGKQMRSLNLLSGGEKCLTAMALLFSLFEVKAAPFCLLDEIDAPLDDTNVGRFSEMVKHFIDRSQFIVITHNKRTMSMGDRLFGVSMEEKGVSKLLRVEFEKEPARAPKEVSLI